MSTRREYRHIPMGFGACEACDQVVKRAWSKARVGHAVPLYAHGPRGARCPGSGGPGLPWVEASGLPTWDELDDLDKGAALLHSWKRYWEGGGYAVENYPVRYLVDPLLRSLTVRDACRHASLVTGGHVAVLDRLGYAEFDRLYDAALTVDEVRA